MIIAGIVLIWLACGVLAYGMWTYDYQHREYNYISDSLILNLFFILTGPGSLLASLLISDYYGLSFKAFTPDQRWENFNRTYNFDGVVYKTREEFDEEYP